MVGQKNLMSISLKRWPKQPIFSQKQAKTPLFPKLSMGITRPFLSDFDIRSHQNYQLVQTMGITRPFLSDFDIRSHQNYQLVQTNRMVLKAMLYHIFLSFRLLTHFLLRGLTQAVLRAWSQNHPQVVGTCPAITPTHSSKSCFQD